MCRFKFISSQSFYWILLLLNLLALFFLLLNLTEMGVKYTYNISTQTSNQMNVTEPIEEKNRTGYSPKIFCFIPTTAENIKTRGIAVYEAWAKQCDGLKFVLKLPKLEDNNYPDGGIDISNIMEPPNYAGDFGNYNLTKKIYLSINYIYSEFSTFDWYLKADDDTFIFMDNFRSFLKTKDPNQLITYGFNFKVFIKDGYHSGGAGYVISNEAMKRISEKLDENFNYCPDTGVEDMDIAQCMRNLNVTIGDSTDELGRERFHPFSLIDHYHGYFPEWLYFYAQNKPQKGLECCSDSLISFHYMTPQEITKLAEILRNYNGTSPISFKYIIDEFLRTD